VRRGICTGQALFPLKIEYGIPRVRPWKELLVSGAQATWLARGIFFTQDGRKYV